jgi:hypothetical protein
MVALKRWILGAVLLAGGCKSAPSEDQCKQLLDRLIDLELKRAGTAGASESAKADLAKSKQALSDARATEFVEICMKRTARQRVECALGATDLEAVTKCDEVK